MAPSPVEELALLDLERSNKGASKQRRDQINGEIANMRDLLPLPESARQRLSQLQIMSLSCVYIRKCNILQKMLQPSSRCSIDIPCDFSQSLTGFILVTTRDGKLVYISENVTEYLGHSMVDMKTQGDSLFDIVDKRDHSTVQAQLLHGTGAETQPDRQLSFFCRMNMSRTLKRQGGFGDVKIPKMFQLPYLPKVFGQTGLSKGVDCLPLIQQIIDTQQLVKWTRSIFRTSMVSTEGARIVRIIKVMHVRGRFVPIKSQETGLDQQVFMALCSPLITPDVKESLIQNNTMVFKSVHKLDMTFIEITESGEFHLGLKNDQMHNSSWYAMLHPEDINEARAKHIQLIKSRHEMGCMMTVRMITTNGDVIWVNIVMHVKQALMNNSDEPVIVCINQVVSEEEAKQFKIQGQLFALYAARAPDLFFGGQHFPPLPPAMDTDVMGHPHPPVFMQQQGMYREPLRFPPYSHPQPGQHSVPYPPHQFTTDTIEQFIPRPQGHHSTIKALKRKLQENYNSTCRPNKVQRLSHIDSNSDGHGIEYQMNVNVFRNVGYEQLFGGDNGVHVFTGGQVPMGYQSTNFNSGVTAVKTSMLGNRVVPVSAVPAIPDVVQKLAPSCVKEQVVPEISIPDCYLTPDPSPATSPKPSTATAESTTQDTQQIKNLTMFVMDRLNELKKNQTLPEVQVKEQKKPKVLPVIDATFVDSFFDDLVSPKRESEKHEKPLQIKVEPVSPEYVVPEVSQTVRSHVYAPTTAPSPPLPLPCSSALKQELTFEDCSDLEELLGLVSSAGSDSCNTTDLNSSSSCVASPQSQVSDYSSMASYSPMSCESPTSPEHYKSADNLSSSVSPGASPGYEGRDILDPDSWLLEPISLSLDMALPELDTISDDTKLNQDDDMFSLKQTMPHPWAPCGVRDSFKDTQ